VKFKKTPVVDIIASALGLAAIIVVVENPPTDIANLLLLQLPLAAAALGLTVFVYRRVG
jgi:hypothetical protein